MNARLRFQCPDFSPRLDESLSWQVESLHWELPGGPAFARLSCQVPTMDLERFNNLVGQSMAAPVEIYSPSGEVIWNGWLSSLVWHNRHYKMTYSLQNVFNRLIVRYPNPNPQANPVNRWNLTDWLEDPVSVARFGAKEKLISIPQADPLLAQKALQTHFQALQKSPSLKIEAAEQDQQGWLEVHCSGWWNRLGWLLDSEDRGLLAHLAGGKTHQVIGRLSSQAKLAQSFWVEQAGFKLAAIWLRAALVGQPLDDLQVAVHADDHGKPGALIAQADAPAASLDGSWSWLVWQLPQPCLLPEGTSTWLVIKRAGALNSESYFIVESDDGLGYTRGSLRRWDGSNWQTIPQDLRFCLMAQEESPVLIQQMLAAGRLGNYIQRFSARELAVSPVNWYRPMEMNLKERMEMWLKREQVCSAIIDARRNLQVFPLPRSEIFPLPVSIKPASYSVADQTLWDGNQGLGCPYFSELNGSQGAHWVQSIEWRQGKGYSWKLMA